MARYRTRSQVSIWGFFFYMLLVALLLMLAVPEWRKLLFAWCYTTAEYWDSAIRAFINQDTFRSRW